jgi:hypothetical protein
MITPARRRCRQQRLFFIIRLILWMVVTTTANCETAFISGNSEDFPSVVDQSRVLSSSNGVTVGDDVSILPSSLFDKMKVTLPRIEVQFLCEYDIRPDFNVTDTFASFFQETINYYLNQYLDIRSDDFGNRSQLEGITNDVRIVGKDDIELYSDLSISGIGDVNSQLWYFPLCNESSTEILATMDVRGYIWFPSNFLPNQPSGGIDHHQVMKPEHDSYMDHSSVVMNFMNVFDETFNQKMLRNYFKDHVCRPAFFRSKIMDWDDVDFPPPSNHQPVQEYQTTLYHNSNAQVAANRDNRYHIFDHNLYLLCAGADDIMYLDDVDDDGIDQGFLMLGIVVGMVMFSMIWTEVQQFAINTSGLPRGRQNDGYAAAATTSTTTTTTTQEVEMV